MYTYSPEGSPAPEAHHAPSGAAEGLGDPWEHLEEMAPKGMARGASTPSHGFRDGQGVSTALSHTAAAHGARGTASHGQGMRSTLSKYYTVSKTKRSKKSKQNSFALNPNLLSSA